MRHNHIWIFVLSIFAVTNLKAQVVFEEEGFFNTYKYRILDSVANEVELTGEISHTFEDYTYPTKVFSYAFYEGRIYRVVGIADKAFKNDTNIQSLIIQSKYLRYIGAEAFFGCRKLNEVSLSCDSLTSIGRKAFADCKSIGMIWLPASIKDVGRKAFDGVQNIDCNHPLRGFPWGAACSKADENGLYYSQDHKTVVAADTTKETIVIPNGVTTIGQNAFRKCKKLKSVVIPEGVAVIEKMAFSSLSSLERVALPPTLRVIGQAAFTNCTALSDIVLPPSIDSIAGYVFVNCRSLTTIELPHSLRMLGDNVFSGCTNLRTLHYNAAHIGDGRENPVFCGQDTLDVIWGNNVERIPAQLFKNIYLRKTTLPPSLREVGREAFADCRFEQPLVVPSSVTTISGNAFKDVVSVSYEGVDAGFPWCALSFGEPYLHDGIIYTDSTMRIAIGSEPDIVEANIPEGVKYIARHAFAYRPLLKTVVFPSSVEDVAAEAFYKCPKLAYTNFADGLVTIGDSAFVGIATTTLRLPNSLQGIGNGAFANIDSLHELTIGRSLTRIGNTSFVNIRVIDTLRFNVECFYDYTRNYMPSFFSNTTIRTLLVGDNVQRIPSIAFSMCDLDSVSLPSSLVYIGIRAFNGNKKLSIHVPDNVVDVGFGAFMGVGNVDYHGQLPVNKWGYLKLNGQYA